MQALWEAEVVKYPFPHFYATGVFSKDFYAEILKRLPADGSMMRYAAYPARRDCQAIWPELEAMFDEPFKKMILEKFGASGKETELRFVRDGAGYALPPHTDKPSKALSLLFYLPADESLKAHGTSLYTPKEQGFVCKEGKHYSFAEFDKFWTAPFLPNTCFGFARTDDSFHGVEPIGNVVRNALLYNVYK